MNFNFQINSLACQSDLYQSTHQMSCTLETMSSTTVVKTGVVTVTATHLSPESLRVAISE